FAEINHAGQTVVMVTHSVRAASCASRVLFLRDGEVSLELTRGKDTDAQFYQRIADALTQQQTGGECA
ncbi:MAG: ABC transporter ATP-binding protein, partial [Oscillospiraceae bacterium]|nr:ABC transporter ATP-binding protein [Oscillospiraceae bacterium]